LVTKTRAEVFSEWHLCNCRDKCGKELIEWQQCCIGKLRTHEENADIAMRKQHSKVNP